ncbi:hypothetical protein E2562_028548 [Oryza meyeriana var. granulata]|uniref:Uncharacterized protein n=1 Tax=Oryza meyeriana var. granulata TaxID=110450 RepID=A0A6G1EQN6_9ORYZ|nr:hypothetical protein E2562_028548 [Oryza meyeriana var. granulata]
MGTATYVPCVCFRLLVHWYGSLRFADSGTRGQVRCAWPYVPVGPRCVALFVCARARVCGGRSAAKGGPARPHELIVLRERAVGS